MPPPTSYTEFTLASYMVAALGDIAELLGITEDAMQEAVTDVTISCGVTDIADATDVAQVRALARVAAIRQAQTMAAGWYDFRADGGDYKRSQVMTQLGVMLTAAESAAMLYGGAFSVGVGTLSYAPDPYKWAAASAAEEGAE